MGFGITFAPLVPNEVLWIAIAAAAFVAVLLVVIRSRGAWIRAIALGCAALALANPSLTREDREALPSVAVVVVDKSPSQGFGERAKQTEDARAALTQRLGRVNGLEVRTVEAGQADGETDGTRLFSALGAALSDVPPDRVAGAVFITDGRVHDVPAEAAQLGFNAPVHALITGRPNERDRRIQLVTAPRFGIVGQTQTIVLARGRSGRPARPVQLTIKRDGETLETRNVNAGDLVRVQVQIPHAGQNIVEIEAAAARERADHDQQPRRGGDRRRARQAARAAGLRRAARWRAHLAQSAQVRRLGRPRALHHSASAREAGRHADQRAVADRVPDARTVPAEDQRVSSHHLRPLRAARRAAGHLLRQHRALRARWRRRAGRGRAGLREPDLALEHAARRGASRGAERADRWRRRSIQPSRNWANAIR